VRFSPLPLVNALFVVVLVLDLLACTDSPPAIGSHLPGSFAVASDAFDQRIKTRFPVGSDEAALRTELVRERFVITRDKDSRWSGADGKIATIGASYKEVCL
jgi:hypothetical protein